LLNYLDNLYNQIFLIISTLQVN